MIGRDWTHIGVAKLYTDIAANGYNILYLTSRSVGQADTTRGYLNGVLQDGNRLPKGPVIMSPDRTMAALRREVYLRKPEVFKMACLRDIMNLFTSDSQAIDNTAPNSPVDAKPAQQVPIHQRTPFYAGFGNRLTDALSYRSVAIPPTRIFTINSNAEVSLHLLTLNSYRTSYLSIWELVDHYFPPVGLLVKDGGEDYTDFNYWRDRPRELIDFSDSSVASDEELEEEDEYDDDRPFILDDETEQEDMESSFMSHDTSVDEPMRESGVLGTVDEEDYDDEDDEDNQPHHPDHHQEHHHELPDTIPEERELEEEEENKEEINPVDTAIVDESGDLLVEESRQLQALDLAAEEEMTIPESPGHLTRSVTAPHRDESAEPPAGDEETEKSPTIR
jgi:phosphatidate phosphatase LPIN